MEILKPDEVVMSIQMSRINLAVLCPSGEPVVRHVHTQYMMVEQVFSHRTIKCLVDRHFSDFEVIVDRQCILSTEYS